MSEVPATTIIVARAVTAAVALLVTGCSVTVTGRPTAQDWASADRALVLDYFQRGNAAARQGPQAQLRFLTHTQHPDFQRTCELGQLTLLLDPSAGTLRPDPGWRPPRSDDSPRGRVYSVAVTVTVRRSEITLGTQIGSMHVVVLDGAAYGFAPCPA